MSNSHNLLSLGHKYLVTKRGEFETVCTLDTAGSTLAVDGRAWADVSSYFSTASSTYGAYSVPKDWNAIELRVQGQANGDSNVIEMWGARQRDHMTLLATLTTTVGTQEADNSDYFVDTIVASNEGLPKSGVVLDSGNNRIARYVVDLVGYDKLLFIATTLGSDEIKIEAGGY